MKKALLAILLLFSFSTMLPAQTPKKKTTDSAKMKKDGTPDMRYKANKTGVKTDTVVHKKKDGTPDKRFKDNKK